MALVALTAWTTPARRARGAGWPRELWALIAGITLVNAFGITWGLPNATGDWAIDSIAPFGPLRYARQMLDDGHWWSKYPPLHFTLLSIVYAPYTAFLVLTGALDTGAGTFADPGRSVTLYTLMARLVSATMGVGTAVVAYRIGFELAGRRAGFLAGVLFAGSPLAVYYASAANLEMPYLFWSSLALLMLVRIARGAQRSDYVRCGIFAAAAIATKDQAYGLFLLLPIPLLAFHARGRGARGCRDARLIAGAGAAVLTYLVAANVVVDFHGWLAHLHYITHEGSQPYQMYPATLAGFARLGAHLAGLVVWTATPPMLVLAVFGFIALRPLARRGAILLLAAVTSYVLTFVAPILYVFPRFVLPLVFVLAILGGVGGAAIWARGSLVARAAVVATVAVVVLYGTSMNLGLVYDSRYAAESWLAANVAPGALVGTNGEGVYLPRVPATLRTVPVDVTKDGLRYDGTAPDYLVLSDAYYARYLRRAVVRPVFLELLQGDGGYERVATFQRRYLPATELIPGLNARIVVMRRVGSSSGEGAGGDPELPERGLDAEHEVVEIRNQVPVGDEAPAELPGVAEQRDAQSLIRQQREHGVALAELRAEQIERDLRARHVGHDEIEGP